jgi:hypothetical protein
LVIITRSAFRRQGNNTAADAHERTKDYLTETEVIALLEAAKAMARAITWSS